MAAFLISPQDQDSYFICWHTQPSPYHFILLFILSQFIVLSSVISLSQLGCAFPIASTKTEFAN
jgi:hypothetical protein